MVKGGEKKMGSREKIIISQKRVTQKPFKMASRVILFLLLIYPLMLPG